MKWLGQEVGDHLPSRYVLNFDPVGCYVMCDKKSSDFNVSTSFTCRAAFGSEKDSGLVILIHDRGADVDSRRNKVLACPQYLR